MRQELKLSYAVHHTALLTVALLGIVSSVCGAPASAPATAPVGRAGSPTDQQIRDMVQSLRHPSRSRRQAAMRQLAIWGTSTIPELKRAAEGDDFEAALAARQLIEEFQGAVLLGARVTLSVDRNRIRWDEPFALSLRVENPSASSIRLPWPRPTAKPPESVPLTTAAQVGAVLDVADFLSVRNRHGTPIDLRIDPIEQESTVEEAVQVRAGSNPPAHDLPAGESETLRVPMLNRGWARYPMLEPGRYAIEFDYQPTWRDPAWGKEGFGRVRCEPVIVEVSDGSPGTILEGTVPLLLTLTRFEQELEARLICTWDRPVWVNLNYGANIEQDAHLEWQWIPRRDGETEELRVSEPPPAREPDRNRLIRLAPGEARTIERIEVARLRALIAADTPQEADSFDIVVRYASLAWPPSVRRLVKLDPPADVLPLLFQGTASSEPLTVRPGDSK